MIIKIALLMWLLAFVVSLVAKAQGRNWMPKLALAGFCLALLAALIRLLRI
jgi:hypothetical protein